MLKFEEHKINVNMNLWQHWYNITRRFTYAIHIQIYS